MTQVVKTSSGRIRGLHEEGVLVFRGIPYAQPPIGPLRFRPPHKPVAWDGVRDACTYGPVPMQGGTARAGPAGDARGLPLSQRLDPRRRRRAAAGAGLAARGRLDPRRGLPAALQRRPTRRAGGCGRSHAELPARPLRLRAWQGVCGDALDTAGHEGILDQIAALEWVRDEIRGFGGDPQNVTVFGQSSGATTAGLLTLMPRTHGLVHKVILQSGSVAFVQPPASADRVMHRLLAAAGLTPAQAGQLRTMPAAALLDLQERVTPRTSGVFYQPVADGDLIPADPFAAVAAGAARGIPLLCGTTLDEMQFFRAMEAGRW